MPIIGKVIYSVNGNGAKKDHPAVSTLFLATDEGDNKHNAYLLHHLGNDSRGNAVVWRSIAQFTDEGRLVYPEGKPLAGELEYHRISGEQYEQIFRMRDRDTMHEYSSVAFRLQYSNTQRALERAKASSRKSADIRLAVSESIAEAV